jgi:hypothetical protein
MSATAPARLVSFPDNAVPASYKGVIDADREAAQVDAPRPNRGIVVELKSRNFTDTAAHFARATTPVKWPLEHDID